MRKHFLTKALVLCLMSLFTLIAYAERDKVIQVFKNGEIIHEIPASEIDYIEVNDLIEAPAGINTTVTTKGITITWNAVEGATYNIYRSPDNVTFELLASDIAETSYIDLAPLTGTNYYRITAIVDGNESRYSQSNAANFIQSDLPSGIYLGIYGFSKGLQTSPLERLSDKNVTTYHTFINNLTATEPFTWLYYSVDKAIDKLTETQFPKDLSEAAIVTFTDGLDIGSLDEKDQEDPGKYLTNAEYRSALQSRLTTEKISGTNISAFTIGIIEGKGANLTTFRNNMNSLASSPANVYEVSDIYNLNQIFKEIANSLSEIKYVQNFILKISGQSHNEKCKFTFDNVNSHSSSKLYIEGVYDRRQNALTDIRYEGLTSSSGTTVKGVYDQVESKNVFTFENLQALDGTLIPTDHVLHWFTDEGVWQDFDNEFTFNAEKDAPLQKIKRSAAIMLNLDCSKSMNGEKLTKLQEAANSFVQTLADNTVDPNEVSSVSIDKTALTLQTGNGAQLVATVLPATAKRKTVTWSSSNTAVATVDAEGYVTAVAPGNAIITVTTNDGSFTATCQVSVVTLVGSIDITPAHIELYVGETETLSATVLPDNATNKNLVWSSSNTSIAVIDGNTVRAVSAGEAIITAEADDTSGVSATCPITVFQHVESVSLKDSEIRALIGKTYRLEATVSPADASNQELIWSSSDPSVAEVDSKGIVTPKAKGTVTITAASVDGGKEGRCIVTVAQPVTEIQISDTSASLFIGETLQLSATLLPDDADNKEIVWTSSNTSVAEVSSSGLVTAIAPGTTTIYATSTETGLQTECTITVHQPLTGILLSSKSVNITRGKNTVISVSPVPSNAYNCNYTVSSSDTSIATVSTSGLYITVTGVAPGTATITVESEEGGYTATANVTVTLSTKPENLALAVQKDGIRYFIPLNDYTDDSSIPSGYEKEGITVSNLGGTFVLDLYDKFGVKRIPQMGSVTVNTFAFSSAQNLGTLPNLTQAQGIIADWSAISDACNKYGGSILGSKTFWTSSTRGGGKLGVCYSSSGVSDADPSTEYYVRCIKATL